MPLEIEIKLKLESHAQVRSCLLKLQAEHVGTVRETNMFFDRADGALRKADSGLRVRMTTSAIDHEPKALLTLKGPAAAVGLRSREAYDLHVTPHDQLIPLLEALGFEMVFSFEKDRDSWAVGEGGEGECLVELDTLPVFGRFLEIEGPSEEAVRAVQRDLGLENVPPYPDSYAKMVGGFLKSRGEKQLRFA